MVNDMTQDKTGGRPEGMGEWKWYAGSSDEVFGHECDTREEAVYYAQNECREEGGYIVEACKKPLSLAEYFDADNFLDHAEDAAYDYASEDGDLLFEVSVYQLADLEQAVRAALTEWQRRNELVFMPWRFTNQRNDEFISANSDGSSKLSKEETDRHEQR